MSLPRAREAQPFYRAALRRFDEAKYLLAGEHWTAAIYLAGYAIECMFKDLVMATIRGTSDPILIAIKEALLTYEKEHPNADVVIYRQNSVSARVRIVDPELAGIPKFDRHDMVWRYFRDLPDEIQEEISVLLLLTPEETGRSLANKDFEDPIPSNL